MKLKYQVKLRLGRVEIAIRYLYLLTYLLLQILHKLTNYRYYNFKEHLLFGSHFISFLLSFALSISLSYLSSSSFFFPFLVSSPIATLPVHSCLIHILLFHHFFFFHSKFCECEFWSFFPSWQSCCIIFMNMITSSRSYLFTFCSLKNMDSNISVGCFWNCNKMRKIMKKHIRIPITT